MADLAEFADPRVERLRVGAKTLAVMMKRNLLVGRDDVEGFSTFGR